MQWKDLREKIVAFRSMILDQCRLQIYTINCLETILYIRCLQTNAVPPVGSFHNAMIWGSVARHPYESDHRAALPAE